MNLYHKHVFGTYAQSPDASTRALLHTTLEYFVDIGLRSSIKSKHTFERLGILFQQLFGHVV